MESSRRPSGIFKGRYVDNRPQRNILRLSNLEQDMEDEDYAEAGVRYVSRKQTARADEGKRTQPRRLGRNTWGEET